MSIHKTKAVRNGNNKKVHLAPMVCPLSHENRITFSTWFNTHNYNVILVKHRKASVWCQKGVNSYSLTLD